MTKRKLVIIQQTENNDYIKELAKTWSQCCFYMIKKNRFCNIEKTPNSEYCGNHRPVEEGTTNRISKKFRLDALETTADNSQRCPCPVDPTHTIYTRNLKSHVLICTATTHNQQMEREPFYKKNCNSGLFIEAETSVDESTEVNCESLVHKIKQCYQGLAVESLSELTHEADKIKIDESDTNNAETCILDAMKVYLTSKNVQRHIQQNVQIVKRMLTSGLLIPTNPTASDIAYVELGAGKGMLGLAVSAVSPRSTVVLVERSGVRQKVDRTMRKQEGQCYRARMDIRHTYLRGLPGVSSTSSALNPTSSVLPEDSKASEERSVVVVAKHLCGVATDLAIRSLLVYRNETAEAELDAMARGLAIATCCHHACIWADYVGRDWLQSHGFTHDEFELMKSWSGWAHTFRAPRDDSVIVSTLHLTDNIVQEKNDVETSAVLAGDEKVDDKNIDGNEEERGTEHGTSVVAGSRRPVGISVPEMSSVGWMVKRIFDAGRVHYLRQQMGLIAHQTVYCAGSLSPENVMLLASQK